MVLTGVPVELRGWDGVRGGSPSPFFDTAALWRKGIECRFFVKPPSSTKWEHSLPLCFEELSGASLTQEFTLGCPFLPRTVTPTLSYRFPARAVQGYPQSPHGASCTQ